MGMDMAAGLINITCVTFLSHIVNAIMGRGHGRVLGPVEALVSTLDMWVVGRDVLMNWTCQN
jgi:hypothetical protein